MMITIKKGPHGYYVDLPGCVPNSLGEPVPDTNPENRKKIILHLEAAAEDVEVSFDECFPLITSSAEGEKLVMYADAGVVVDVFYQEDNSEKTLQEFCLNKDSGVWAFLVARGVADVNN